jgi:hypothetical protein
MDRAGGVAVLRRAAGEQQHNKDVEASHGLL